MNGITQKGKSWEWGQTWWLIGLSVILLGWISFVYMGIRTKTKKWMIEGVIYCVILNLVFVFSNFNSLFGMYFAVAIAAWIISIIRVILSRKEYLLRLEYLESIEDRDLKERIRAEYANEAYEPMPSRNYRPTEPVLLRAPQEEVVKPVEPMSRAIPDDVHVISKEEVPEEVEMHDLVLEEPEVLMTEEDNAVKEEAAPEVIIPAYVPAEEEPVVEEISEETPVEVVTPADEPIDNFYTAEPEPTVILPGFGPNAEWQEAQVINSNPEETPVATPEPEVVTPAYIPNDQWQKTHAQNSLREDMPVGGQYEEDGGENKVLAWIKGHKWVLLGLPVLLVAAIIIAVCITVFDKDELTFAQSYVSLYAGTSEGLTLQSKKERTYTPDQLVYTSSNESVATVDTYGKVQGLTAGTATITCKTAKGRCEPASVEVTVKNDVLSISGATYLSLTEGDTRTVSVNAASGIRYMASQLSYTSSATNVATVDNQGNIKAVSPGSARISVKKADGTSNVANISVTVKEKLVPVSIKNGEMLKRPSGSRKAPLKMEVGTGRNYYIYFKHQSNSKNDFAFYVASGKSVRFNVPLGTYTVYYATGQTWYGKKLKFGPSTVMLKLNGGIKFYKTSRAYVGKSIKLYPVANGNLSSSIVGSGEFPD